LHGWPDPFQDIYHLDLLHIARRLWKDLLPSCTLGDLEHHILELERDELDIPGWKVAEYFFSYLQDGDPGPLMHILYHNEIDVLSLVTLLSYITERLSIPLDDKYTSLPDLIPVGKFLAEAGETEKAVAVISHALLENNLPEAQRISGSLELASIRKKSGLLKEAVPLWIESAELGNLDAKIELAKYYEHQKANYEEAIHWTLSALESVTLTSTKKNKSLRSGLEHRLQRLKNKAKQ
jgi:tetratricopeptide (TPR) repeat protein